MHGTIATPTFLADAKVAGVSDAELEEMASIIADDPEAGDIIPGTGGARKIRIGGRGKGKSGGYRVITYYAAADVPVFLLALVSKGQRADISQAARNVLRQVLPTLADDYRKSTATQARKRRS
jgi:hypothetical protein